VKGTGRLRRRAGSRRRGGDRPAPTTIRERFWRRHRLEELTPAEWEALCDGCARCCAIKLEDEETGVIHHTRVACRLLDIATCRCGNYPLRASLVPGCIVLTPKTLRDSLGWLPPTCAYRLVAEGRDLYPWHPLVSGDPDSVHRAGISMRDRMVPEYEVAEEDLEDHVIWEE
jgi:uncharacterized cysteine cluster protein YcgN (CxxCxxCC family)